MAANGAESWGGGRIQFIEARLIEDPAEQDRLNRILRRPGDRTLFQRWRIPLLVIALASLMGLLGFFVRGLFSSH